MSYQLSRELRQRLAQRIEESEARARRRRRSIIVPAVVMVIVVGAAVVLSRTPVRQPLSPGGSARIQTGIPLLATAVIQVIGEAAPFVQTATPVASEVASRALQYKVVPGDSLTGIATRFHVTVIALAAANQITDADSVRAGDVLTVPSP